MFSEVRSIKPLEMRVVFLVYALLAGTAAIWDWSSRGDPFWVFKNSQIPSLKVSILAIIGVFLYWAIVRILSRWSENLRSVEGLFSQLLSPISYLQIVVISATTAIVEEWFFRGILVGHFGLILSALVFALCHLIPSPRLWTWSIWSFIAAILLGVIYQETKSLYLPILIHFLVNILSLVFINWRAYQTPRFNPAG